MTPLVQLKKQFSPFGFVTPRALVSLVFCVAAGFIVTGTLLAFFHLEAPTKISQRTLTLADRVAYQRAIEDVYWRRRIWPKENPGPNPSLDPGMSQAQLENKVARYLHDSQALEDYWQKPITAEQLQAEIDRMANQSKQPEVLRELFGVLGNDPFVIAECLARPALSERLVTSLYAHEEDNRSAEPGVKLKSREWDQNVQKLAPMFDEAKDTMARPQPARRGGNYTLPKIADGTCADDTWIAHNPLFPPANRVLHTAVWTGSEMIVWGRHIANSPFETNTGGRYNPGTDSWTTTSTATQYNGLVASLRDVPASGLRPGAMATFVKNLNHSSVPWVSVMDYGAVADDATDNTAAFNRAIADAGPTGTIYVPAGTYRILGQIELNGGNGVNWPARLVGAGNKLSSLHITPAALATQTVGTIQAARGACVSDLRFVYDQPDVATYGTFNQYKPVIYVNQTFVFRTTLEDRGTYFHRGGRYERLRIEAAWDGITCMGGAFVAANRPWFGQEIFDDLEMGTLNRGLDLDAISDSCYINRLRVYPYGLTTRQQVAQQLPGHSVGIYAGRTDDMRVSNSFFLNGRGVDLHAGADKNGPHANFVNCSFDSFAHLQIGDGAPATGYAQFTNCHFSNGPRACPQDTDVTTSYMNVYFTACLFIHVQHTGINCIETHADPTGSHAVYLDNCEFTMHTHDASAITGDAMLSIKGCHFYRSAGTYTNPTIDVTGGLATIVDNQAAPLTTGSGVFLALQTDDYHMVANNVVPGWSITYPATTTKVKSLSNSASSGSYLLGGTNLAGRPTNQTSSTNPTGTTSTVGVMVGLGYTITPTINGKVFVTISGSCVSDTANVGGNVRLRWSTGTPPANGDAVTGAQVGGIAQRQQGSWSAGATSPFSLSGIISTSAGTTIWVDLQQTVVGSGTFSVLNVAGSLFELP